MMKKLLILALLLMASCSFACDVYIDHTSFPVKTNLANTEYCMTESIGINSGVAFWTAWSAPATNITLNCQGYEIVATGGASPVYASGQATNIKNCYFSAESNWAVYFGGATQHGAQSTITDSVILGSILIDTDANNTYISNSYISNPLPLGSAVTIYGNGGTIINSTLSAPSSSIGAIKIAGGKNMSIVGNTINGQKWVFGVTSTTAFAHNYYTVNGTSASVLYNLIDTNRDGYADSGTDYPISATTIPARWNGLSNDSSPRVVTTTDKNAMNVQIFVVDFSYAPMPNTSVKIQQIDPSTGSAITIGTFVTDAFGTTTQSLLPTTQLYHFTVYDNTGKMLQDYPNTGINCQTTNLLCKEVLMVQGPIATGYVSTFNYANATCSYDNSSGLLECQPLGLQINNTLLTVAVQNATAYNSSICQQTGIGLANVSCTLSTEIGNCYNYVFRAELNTGETPVLAGGQICTSGYSTFTPNSGTGLILTFILVAMLALLGMAFGPSGVFIGAAFGLMIAVGLSFLTGIAWVAGIGGIAALLVLAWTVK